MNEKNFLFYEKDLNSQNKIRQHINHYYHADETHCLEHCMQYIEFNDDLEKKIHDLAFELVQSVRQHNGESSAIEAMMIHYDLSTEEGILLMCLAESLLRVPDKETEQLLIKDKLLSAKWDKHIGASESTVVNMATWGLALSGKILHQTQSGGYLTKIWKGLLKKSGEPVIRRAVREAMKILSEYFVIGRTIQEAIKHSESKMKKGYRFSYDMLGEVARTRQDADKYYHAYEQAIIHLGESFKAPDIFVAHSISIKLSALHPRYEYTHREVVLADLMPRVKKLALKAQSYGMSLTIDAEEANRLELSLDIFEALFKDPEFANWEGLGLAVQAYQKRAFYLLDWLIDLARRYSRRIQVRLVKGAYWDSEIKTAQVDGYSAYPVFTRKVNTDVSYLACAKKMLEAQDAIYPQFATHNAYSVAAILSMMENDFHQYQFEFQNLQGMGKALHDYLVSATRFKVPCRIYAPVGSHKDLLPYLVRRLLENGANSSFVNNISDKSIAVDALIKSPVQILRSLASVPNAKIPLPWNIYGVDRKNSQGMDLSDVDQLDQLSAKISAASKKRWMAAPTNTSITPGRDVLDPNNHNFIVGTVQEASHQDVEQAMHHAQNALIDWQAKPVNERALILKKAADLMEAHMADFMYLAIREAGKTLQDAISEVREAIDFCRYYAFQAEKVLSSQSLTGYTGESNRLSLTGRGIIVCISPWNFPLAIFTGQVAAALVTGNVVIAKPAEQTPLIASFASEMFYQAGLSKSVLQILPGQGEIVGKSLVDNGAIAGVMFTGSNETAKAISRTLANRNGPIVPFIAETGGINAMIADSTALPEQLVQDVLTSAFGSAGQRCSALRILFVQADIADLVMTMLAGAMAEMDVGDPMLLRTDVGPIIDNEALERLQAHIKWLEKEARLIAKVPLVNKIDMGTFIAPQAYELADAGALTQEVFGPILHVVRYESRQLDAVIDQINQFGYGLTFGIHSRIDSMVNYIQSKILAGNIYVNRNMIGAVVGVQPFGGCRLSGTGPKAGGPHYLTHLCRETTVTVDTTAAGGNATLMSMID